jgi:glycosyltransferase involved in cell wall biosynthesis
LSRQIRSRSKKVELTQNSSSTIHASSLVVPLVSIITPAYNASRFLGATLTSALRQTMTDFELLVVDDGSTDDTGAIAERFAARDDRIRVIRKENGGSATARNVAIEQSNGEFLALLDSDDLWMPGFLSSQLGLLLQNRQIDIVSANAINLGGALDGRPLKPAGGDWYVVDLKHVLEVDDSVCIMSVFRRTVVDRVGLFDPAVWSNEDYDFWIRAASAGCTIAFNPRPSGYYRRRADSKSADEEAMIEGILGVYEKARTLCAGRPEELAAINRQVLRFKRQRLITRGKAALRQGDLTTASAAFGDLTSCSANAWDRALGHIGSCSPRSVLWAYAAKSAWRRFSRDRLPLFSR